MKTIFFVVFCLLGFVCIAQHTTITPNVLVRPPIVRVNGATIGRTNNTRPSAKIQPTVTTENGMTCSSRRIEFTESNFERIISGGIWDKIYPGAIYQANSVADGSFRTLDLPRNPMRMAVNLIAAPSGKISTTIQPVNLNRSGIWQGISYLLDQNRTVVNASRAVFELKQIFSREQLQVFVGGDFTGWGASVQATFNTSNTQARNVYIVKLTQVYFDIVVDDNQNLVTTPPTDDNAVYIHAVSYGKIGYLRIESNESEQTIRAALNARYNWGSGNAGVQANVDYNKVLRESQTVGFVLGGSAQVITNADQFNQYVRDARWNPSVQIQPISYKLKFLRDRSDAYVSMTTSYTERICEPIRRGTILQVTTQSGSDDLRSYNTAFLAVNFNNGTSSREYLLHRGLGQNQSATQNISLGQEIDVVNVRSISIRHDGTPNNNPFTGGDLGHTCDNWDLMAFRVSLLTPSGLVNIYNNILRNQSTDGDHAPIRFTGDKRTAEFKKQD
ncbi:MAG: thiol-activated cytolysin family protein [Haliscomenobacter sp.]|uniref:thiol-activated cytolysin family protein n=1 Tax=Haliscomenobacter sp. TaxID=2717303 RepID=UPI0029A07EA3|nr:thiol-activated cytolysin family protein [Haliscomenobacter sp.]MDX2068420.1 thiol-activated cytolysin family protein [Haliscomenobacter sp.]